MKIVLLFAPPGNASQPYTSLPALTAFMRREGYQVVQRDISIEAVEDLLTGKRLAQTRDRVQNRLKTLERQVAMSPENEAKYEALCRVAVSAEYVSRHIDEAKQTLRSPTDFFDFDRFAWAVNLVQRGRELLSAEYYPSLWNETNVAMPRYSWSVSDLLAATEDEGQNIFLEYFRYTVVPSIEAESPDLIGISITYSGQIIPSLTLARLLKSRCPEAHICLGGAILSSMHGELQQNPSIFAVADSIAVWEGEHALLGLARALENETALVAIPNLLYLDHDQVQATSLHIEDVNNLPTPDYSGLPLELYLTPEVTALLPTERGCYWKRCAFCTISMSMHTYRPRKIELVLEDMKNLGQQLNTRCFFLANDATPPARMRALAQAISAEELDFIWQTEARLEKSLTPETCRTLVVGGCRRLMLGLESASPRVLALMEKGVTIDQAARAIHNCHDPGIATHVFFILGFPTETRQETRETLAFVHDHHAVIQSINYAQFDFNCGSKVYNDPARYGITWMERPPSDWLNGNIYTYEVSHGMSPDEVSTEMYPEAVHFFSQVFNFVNASPRGLMSSDYAITQHASWALLNYLAHYHVTRLEELPITSVVSRIDDQPIPNLVPHPAGRLLYHRLNSKMVTVFNPATGDVITVPTEARILLSLCNGQESVRQLSNRLASTYEGIDFIKAYYLGLQLCAELIARGYLAVARPDRISGSEA